MCLENTPWCVLGTHLFLQCEAEKRPKFKNLLRTYPRLVEAEERRRTFILDTAQDRGKNIFFSVNIHQRNIVHSVVHVQLCYKSFLLIN